MNKSLNCHRKTEIMDWARKFGFYGKGTCYSPYTKQEALIGVLSLRSVVYLIHLTLLADSLIRLPCRSPRVVRRYPGFTSWTHCI